METLSLQTFTGERALFASRSKKISECIFDGGESPLKESEDIEIEKTMFRWKYPLWYCKNVSVRDSVWFEMARAGVWYSDGVTVSDSLVKAPKNFRRCKGLTLRDTVFTDAKETLWSCEDVTLDSVSVKGDYFAMNCTGVKAKDLVLDGNYSFDGAKNVTVEDSRLVTKDAFWNSENVTVRNSFITGEYLGWNSRDLTLIGCTIESLQGMCYIKNLKMIDCRLINTTLAFEYSDVDAEITTGVESVLNPSCGTIKAGYIGELIVEPDRVDPNKTRIICSEIKTRSDRPEWLR
ncbi:MAG: DUF3737 family protein [Clostridia bacterium]|nr:DUF3737 family protein [Clostridia bacterium]